MQYVTDELEANTFLGNMSQSLADLSCWKEWHALEIIGAPALQWVEQAKITSLIRTLFGDCSGSMLWIKGSVLMIVHKKGKLETEQFTHEIHTNLNLPRVVIHAFSIEEEPKQMQGLFKQYVDDRLPASIPTISYQTLKSMIPHIDDLLKEWKTNKKNREGRDRPSIMVVDDDPLTLRIVTHALGKDYSVITAHNGTDAIEKHLQQTPDIIFLDIGLPDCDGLTLLHYMQQYDPECQVVMFSADDRLKTRIKALAEGAKGFADKPFNKEAFKGYIAKWAAH